MKVIFLDFDGCLNSEASFRYETRRKILHVQDTLSSVACSNLQYILEQDSSVKLVISSDWRLTRSLDQLGHILNSYGVESARILGKTPSLSSGERSQEIKAFLEANPNITTFVILDDDNDVLKIHDLRGHVFITTPEDGLLLKQAKQIAKLFLMEKRLPGWSADGKEWLPNEPGIPQNLKGEPR